MTSSHGLSKTTAEPVRRKDRTARAAWSLYCSHSSLGASEAVVGAGPAGFLIQDSVLFMFAAVSPARPGDAPGLRFTGAGLLRSGLS